MEFPFTSWRALAFTGDIIDSIVNDPIVAKKVLAMRPGNPSDHDIGSGKEML